MKMKLVAPRVRRAVVMISIPMFIPATGFAERQRAPSETAEPPAEGARVTDFEITWQEIVGMVDEHPRLAASRHDVAAARAAVNAAGAVPNPEVEGTVAHGEAVDGSASRFEWGVELTIPLGWIAQRGARMDAADYETRAEEAEALALRQEVLLQLRVLFWNLVYEQERVAALAELAGQTGALATTIARRVEKGDLRPVEATRVEVEAEKVAGELDVARSSLEARRQQLAAWLAVPTGKRVVAVADLSRLPESMNAEQARKRARTDHPAVVAASERVRALSAAVSAERRTRVPSFAVGAFTDHELDRRAYGAVFSVDLPVWNWRSGAIRRSESLLAAGKMRLEAERLDIETAAIEAHSTCRAGVTLAARYRDRILPRAESAARSIERTYRLGETTLIEVIDARRTLLDTRREFLEALVMAQTDCSRLAALTGEEMK